MTTLKTPNGKPDAGNPHVRFDEGEVAPAKPRRGSLLYKVVKKMKVVKNASFCILNTFLVSTLWGGVVATGGSVTRIHNDYIHTFTESGTFTVVKPGTVQVLVVGGGGGGGSWVYGGGGEAQCVQRGGLQSIVPAIMI